MFSRLFHLKGHKPQNTKPAPNDVKDEKPLPIIPTQSVPFDAIHFAEATFILALYENATHDTETLTRSLTMLPNKRYARINNNMSVEIYKEDNYHKQSSLPGKANHICTSTEGHLLALSQQNKMISLKEYDQDLNLKREYNLLDKFTPYHTVHTTLFALKNNYVIVKISEESFNKIEAAPALILLINLTNGIIHRFDTKNDIRTYINHVQISPFDDPDHLTTVLVNRDGEFQRYYFDFKKNDAVAFPATLNVNFVGKLPNQQWVIQSDIDEITQKELSLQHEATGLYQQLTLCQHDPDEEKPVWNIISKVYIHKFLTVTQILDNGYMVLTNDRFVCLYDPVHGKAMYSQTFEIKKNSLIGVLVKNDKLIMQYGKPDNEIYTFQIDFDKLTIAPELTKDPLKRLTFSI